MTHLLVTCLQCGAELKTAPDQYGIVRCEYCGASNRVSDIRRGNEQPAQPFQSDSAATIDLPSEYAKLKRPKPGAPLENAGCGAIFGLIWTIFSSFFVIMGVGIFVNGYLEYNRLSREGVDISATITELEVDDSGDSTSYLVYYQFKAPVNSDFIRFEDHESVSSSFYSSLKVEQKIEVLYATSDPSLSAIKVEFGPPNIIFPLVFAGMGGLFVLIGVGMLYGSIRAQFHLRRLRSEGQQTRGIVFGRWEDKDSEGDRTYFAAYAFRTPSGQIVTRAEQNRDLYQAYQIGDSVEVRYVPDEPSICQARTFR